jgi:hypothetical protein
MNPIESMGLLGRLQLAMTLLFSPSSAARALFPAPLLPAPADRVVEVDKVVERVVEVEKVVERVVEKVIEKERPAAEGALHLLAILQREGRLIDFLREDIKGFADAEVGAAVRQVHAGCNKALDQVVTLAAIRSEDEGSIVTLDVGFDAQQVVLAGSVSGDPPYRGTLAHGGWRATEINLPLRPSSFDARIIAAAEVMVGS